MFASVGMGLMTLMAEEEEAPSVTCHQLFSSLTPPPPLPLPLLLRAL